MSYDLYQENILDHYKHPRNKGIVTGATLSFRELNPLCGDEITFSAKVENGTVKELLFDGHGCAISQASASMLAESLEGRKLEAVRAFSKDDVMELLGIPISAARLKCALLGLRVLKEAVYRHDKMDERKIKDRLVKEGLIL